MYGSFEENTDMANEESDYLKRPDAKGYLKVLECLRQWDPMGVVEDAPDEYDSYIPEIIDMLDGGIETEHLAAYLMTLAREHMGVSCDKTQTDKITGELVVFWKKWKTRRV
jgi:hypothetical protein